MILNEPFDADEEKIRNILFMHYYNKYIIKSNTSIGIAIKWNFAYFTQQNMIQVINIDLIELWNSLMPRDLNNYVAYFECE